MHRQETGLVKQ